MAQPRKSKAGKRAGAISSPYAPSTQQVQTNGASAPAAGNGDLSHSLQMSIAALAYDLYLRRGRSDGRDLEDWLKAEELIKAEGGHVRRR